MDIHGRRPVMLRSIGLVCISLAVLSVGLWQGCTQQDHLAELEALGGGSADSGDSVCPEHGSAGLFPTVGVVALLAYLLAFGSGASGVPWTMNSEIYPIRARSKANAQSVCANWVSNWVIAATFVTLTDNVGVGQGFCVCLACSLVGFVGCWLWLPETNGKTLEEIDGIFSAPTMRASAQNGICLLLLTCHESP